MSEYNYEYIVRRIKELKIQTSLIAIKLDIPENLLLDIVNGKVVDDYGVGKACMDVIRTKAAQGDKGEQIEDLYLIFLYLQDPGNTKFNEWVERNHKGYDATAAVDALKEAIDDIKTNRNTPPVYSKSEIKFLDAAILAAHDLLIINQYTHKGHASNCLKYAEALLEGRNIAIRFPPDENPEFNDRFYNQ